MMWKVSRESVMLLGGRAAVLMQIAHPLVAAGVAQHSNYRADPYGRLRRTLDVMYTIVFESADDAREAARHVAHVHSFVKGTAADGRVYSAENDHLKLWVHSTLVWSSIKVYERFVAPLNSDELERYYEETKVVGRLFGLPDEALPPTYAELRAWMRSMIDSGEVHVTDVARELAEPIVRPLRIVPKGLSSRGALVTPSLLPRPIREAYGLKINVPRAAVLAVGSRASRLLLPLMPGAVRSHPLAREAERRIA